MKAQCIKQVNVTDINDRFLYTAFLQGDVYRFATIDECNAYPGPGDGNPRTALINKNGEVHYMDGEFYAEHFKDKKF